MIATTVMRRLILASAAVVFVSFPAAAQPTSAQLTRERIVELENFVVQDCGSCHGLTMQGGLGLPLTRERMADYSTESLAYTILEGRPDTPMPPWRGLLDEADAEWIARYLKGETDVR